MLGGRSTTSFIFANTPQKLNRYKQRSFKPSIAGSNPAWGTNGLSSSNLWPTILSERKSYFMGIFNWGKETGGTATLERIAQEKGTTSAPVELSEAVKIGITEHTNYTDQLKHEIQLLSRLPEMSAQRNTMQAQLEMANRCLAALEAGFEPVTPSTSWHMGFLSAPPHARAGYKIYKRAMPEKVVTDYIRAKALKSNGKTVFDVYTVHSPDAEAFHVVPPRLKVVDPLLVGWVNVDAREDNSGTTKLFPITGQDKFGFLIGAWDLASDLAFNPLLLAAPKTE